MAKRLDNTDDILAMYESGVSSKEVAKYFGINQTTIPKMYKRKYKIKSMLPSQGNIRYFQNIDSSLKAYFLGFIAADGCITRDNCLKINIVETDRTILDKLKSEIGCEHKISIVQKKNGKPQVTFGLSNDLLKQDLMSYGILPRKSLTMENIIPNIPKEYRNSFILGYFDGDGYASISFVYGNNKRNGIVFKEKQYPCFHIGFCGTKEFLNGITDEIQPKSFRIKLNKSIHTLELSVAKKEVIKYFNYLYKNQTFYLKRKYNKFIEYFKTINYDPFNQDQTISSS